MEDQKTLKTKVTTVTQTLVDGKVVSSSTETKERPFWFTLPLPAQHKHLMVHHLQKWFHNLLHLCISYTHTPPNSEGKHPYNYKNIIEDVMIQFDLFEKMFLFGAIFVTLPLLSQPCVSPVFACCVALCLSVAIKKQMHLKQILNVSFQFKSQNIHNYKIVSLKFIHSIHS